MNNMNIAEIDILLDSLHSLLIALTNHCVNSTKKKPMFSYKIDEIGLLEAIQGASYNTTLKKLIFQIHDTTNAHEYYLKAFHFLKIEFINQQQLLSNKYFI